MPVAQEKCYDPFNCLRLGFLFPLPVAAGGGGGAQERHVLKVQTTIALVLLNRLVGGAANRTTSQEVNIVRGL